jgi:hypothetical protein
MTRSSGTVAASSRRRSRVFAVAVVTVGALIAGCSGGTVPKTVTQEQAARRAEQIIRATVAALRPEPKLNPYTPMTGPTACTANTPDASQMVNVVYTYLLAGFPASENGSIGRQVLAYWQKQRYTIQGISGFNQNAPHIAGYTQDGYLIALDWTAGGTLAIGTTSPCVFPDATPSP